LSSAARTARSISVIVPALNEEAVVEGVVRDILLTVERIIPRFELILIDDGSKDRTGEIMDRLARERTELKVVHNEVNIGLGASYACGVRLAQNDYVLMLCGDGGLPASSISPILEAVGNADIVIPYMTNLKRIKTPARYLLSRGYTRLMNLLFRQKLMYYNGLSVHRREFLRQIAITSSRFGFQGEVLVKLLRAGCSYVEVGVEGAEVTQSSSALRLRNLASVAKTVVGLVWELYWFRPPQLERVSAVTTDDDAVKV
jgi:glycosyltransferase involved in cell wall biosynthesis